MSYQIKNGIVWVLYNNQWWLGDILYTLYPALKGVPLKQYTA